MLADAPQTRELLELKEEIVQNLMEKYNDLRAEGKSDEAAFHIALGSIGDISALAGGHGGEAPPSDEYDAPPAYHGAPEEMYVADEEYLAQYQKRRSATLVALAVMLYILCPVPAIVFGHRMGPMLLLMMVAAATGILIYNGMTRSNARPSAPVPPEDTALRNDSRRHLLKALSSSLWTITTATYFLVSFGTGAWHISWVVFPIGAAINNVLRAFVDLGGKGGTHA